MKIAIDAMGGDYAPEQVVLGAIQASQTYGYEIVLVGDSSQIESEIKKTLPHWNSDNQKITIQHASEVIGMDEHPAVAVRRKKDASVVVATRLVRDKHCDAVLSAGNTGAAVAAALFTLGRIKGVERPTIATPIPTRTGDAALLLDSGANVDGKPKHLAQSAIMGATYAQCVYSKAEPRVGLLNIGEESTKGNEQAQTTYPILESMSTINFCGNAEGRDIPEGTFDVVVCDGFVGNIVLKFAEGLAKTLIELLKEAINNGGFLAKLGAFLLVPTLKKLAKRLDANEYGGAPLLGVNGCCIISHGSSNAKSICSGIRQAAEYVESDVLTQIRDNIEKEDVLNHES